MPEGPECASTAQFINKFMSNKEISNIAILSGRYSKKNPDGLEEIRSMLPVRVSSWSSKGKFIYGHVDSGRGHSSFIWNTLGMSGYWTVSKKKHSRLRFDFSDGSSIWYTDMRNFGTIKFNMSHDETQDKLLSLGPDPLNVDINIDTFKEQKGRKNNMRRINEPKNNIWSWKLYQGRGLVVVESLSS